MQQIQQQPEPAPDEPAPRTDIANSRDEIAQIIRAPEAEHPGHLAENPAQIPWAGWKAVLRRTLREMISDRASIIAAGCAFYATLALFPGISMLIFIYGLAFDPQTVEPQLAGLRELLPPSAYQLIGDRVHMLVTQQHRTLGLGLVISTAVTLWSATAGVKSIIAALNMAYEEKEQRSFLRYQLTAFGMTLCTMLGISFAIALLVFLPAMISFLGISSHAKGLIQGASLLILVVFLGVSLSLVYRFGPSRRPAKWHWVTPGSVLATVLWLLASALFSFYVGRIASYDVTYGPLGAVVGMMMWFYVGAYVLLLGAELNSELELQTARDSTEGPPKPIGKRGAFVADHVAEG